MMKQNKPVDLSPFRHLYPYRSNHIDIDGLKYHYLDQGKGDPVLMLHGNPTWSFYFRRLVDDLSHRFRTIVPDHIGCGLSDKPGMDSYDYRLQSRVDDVATLLHRLHIRENISLIVHDWGGAIGMAYALKFPQRIARLVVMNTAAFFPPEGKKLPLRLRLVRNTGPLATLALQGFNLFAIGALHMAAYKKLAQPVKKGLVAPYNSWRNRIATLTFVKDIPVASSHPSYNLIKFIDDNLYRLGHLPMMILWGERDFVFDMDYLAEWRHRFPAAEVHTFSNAGHYVLEDVPVEISTLVRNFLLKAPA
jgi:haloalkane dehalogenase